MKECFKNNNIESPKYFTNINDIESFPIVAKKIYGSKGRGMFLIESKEDLKKFKEIFNKVLKSYYFERYHNYTREYGIHVTQQEYFYTCRKMLKSDTPKNERWFRNSTNCVWFLEENENFNKPKNWDNIVNNCINACKAVGLDFGACDVIVSKEGKFKIVEINSAPSFGEPNSIVESKYREILPILVDRKIKEKNKECASS
jgi:D-alanine-D-alanine ligase-like ATP-grasp enzyme